MPVEMIQHPVGQGGFFAGSVGCDGRRFRWIYDCGSFQTNKLHLRIDDFLSKIKGDPDDRDIHILFVSHIDSDHVNGLEYLFERCEQYKIRVRQVVIPYLSAENVLVGIASDKASQRPSRSFLELALNASDWFTRRGAEIVTQVDGGSEGPVPNPEGLGTAGGPQLENSGFDDSDRAPREGRSSRDSSTSVLDQDDDEIKPVWISKRNARWKTNFEKSDKGIRSVSKNSIIALKKSSKFMDWNFVPYSHEPPEEKVIDFKVELKKKFSNMNCKDIIKSLSNKANVDNLKSCYDKIWKDHNLVSMALYMGPSHTKNNFIVTGNRGLCVECPGGWLVTGDAKLSDIHRPMQFESHYKNYADYVSVLMVPHHGSLDSFRPSILDPFKNLYVCYAAVGANKYRHPSDSVLKEVEKRGIEFRSVRVNANTTLKSESIYDIACKAKFLRNYLKP